MPEIAHAFGRLESSNEGANASLQSIDCALGRLAQQCLLGMEHRFNWIEVRRILRQVSRFGSTVWFAVVSSIRRVRAADDAMGASLSPSPYFFRMFRATKSCSKKRLGTIREVPWVFVLGDFSQYVSTG